MTTELYSVSVENVDFYEATFYVWVKNFINKKLCNLCQIEICLLITLHKKYILELMELDNILLIKIFIRKLKVDLKSLNSPWTHCMYYLMTLNLNTNLHC